MPFTGEQYDASTGLYYLRARYYDPRVGRFTQRDPFPGLATLPQTLNPYVYVVNNPVNLTDPSGKFPLLAFAIAAGVYAGGYALYDYADSRVQSGWGRTALDATSFLMGYESIQQDVKKLGNPCMSSLCKVLAAGDIALNSALGISTLMGIGSGLKSIKAAWAMRNMTIGGRLGYLGNIARAAGVTSMEVGQGFYRPLGERTVIVARDALRDPWRLAGGFFHELAHHGQEFGTPSAVRWISQGMQWVSKNSSRSLGWVFSPLGYFLNPVEIHAATSGSSYWLNLAWASIVRPSAATGTQRLLNWGCEE